MEAVTTGQERLNVANKMADKKKSAGQSGSQSGQATGLASRQSSETTGQPVKSVKAMARDKQKERPQVESKPARRESKGPSLDARIRSNRIGRFVMEAYYELRHKVTWPTFVEARNMTAVVIILSAAVGVILWLADTGLTQLFILISGK